MDKRERKKKIFDEIRADQARHDDLTRRLKERIERGYAEAREKERRASS